MDINGSLWFFWYKAKFYVFFQIEWIILEEQTNKTLYENPKKGWMSVISFQENELEQMYFYYKNDPSLVARNLLPFVNGRERKTLKLSLNCLWFVQDVKLRWKVGRQEEN